MSLQQYNNRMGDLRRWNDLWDPVSFWEADLDFPSVRSGATSALWKPCVDVKETANSMIIHCELPGLNKDQIQLDVSEGKLTISGERVQESKEENEKFHRIERSYGKFQRTFTVPENCNTKDIQAKFENGVLDICIPKCESKQKPQKIMIK
ncbi:hypothetical protein SAMD00019534_022810 [Acytostelium subglobosum LB1]|uniref:hypothetical protein n=1 Tax=Acytostelium subglobosum LB1 TaxID=1410327 RepID=UPI000644E22E|nr:hypothetical protein SAMD00019534_022810 [Acytostelium subglobosum LB1]GAM19106.1 hypothetical protein SAMD00019534_022810 [Acytostelium subglobosum LB1]|eukprot:XP_012757033.1 hypothetical protein SAMD00019534_022810 [Acytostelium subglobosum LB1]